MAKKITIKEIAAEAGVSIGTVDRVLHNRGRVSSETRDRINAILQEAGYRFNLHASAHSMRRKYKIVVTLPLSPEGGYWHAVREGNKAAVREFNDLNLEVFHLPYSQFDVYSCQKVFSDIPSLRPDAVIIGTIFAQETVTLCKRLDAEGIPYFLVDSIVDGVHPVAAYSVNQHACGMLAARLLHKMSGGHAGRYLLLESARVGRQWSANSQARREGFTAYFRMLDAGLPVDVATFSLDNPHENDTVIREALEKEEELLGVAVMNSHGHAVAGLFREHASRHIPLAAFDATGQNVTCLEKGEIDVLLCQRPQMQGYQVTVSAIRHLVYKEKKENALHYLPIDIVMQDNLPFYQELVTLNC